MGKILIIDDEKQMLALLSRILELKVMRYIERQLVKLV